MLGLVVLHEFWYHNGFECVQRDIHRCLLYSAYVLVSRPSTNQNYLKMMYSYQKHCSLALHPDFIACDVQADITRKSQWSRAGEIIPPIFFVLQLSNHGCEILCIVPWLFRQMWWVAAQQRR
jgi:hypothetical protein